MTKWFYNCKEKVELISFLTLLQIPQRTTGITKATKELLNEKKTVKRRKRQISTIFKVDVTSQNILAGQ